MPLTCNDTLSSVPFKLRNAKEYPGLTSISANDDILAASACANAHEIFSLNGITRLNNPKCRTASFEGAKESYWLVKALIARARWSCCIPMAAI